MTELGLGNCNGCNAQVCPLLPAFPRKEETHKASTSGEFTVNCMQPIGETAGFGTTILLVMHPANENFEN
eukprot:scaffold186788_cov15-Prasinocladus_malaysianus.AAC.1